MPKNGVKLGNYIDSEVYLEVAQDYGYLPALFPDAPPAIYTWQIDTIYFLSGPMITVNIPGWGVTQQRDETRTQRIEIEKTDSFNDPGGTDYLLVCTRLDVEPSLAL